MGLRVPRAAQSTSGGDGGDFCDFDALTVKDVSSRLYPYFYRLY